MLETKSIHRRCHRPPVLSNGLDAPYNMASALVQLVRPSQMKIRRRLHARALNGLTCLFGKGRRKPYWLRYATMKTNARQPSIWRTPALIVIFLRCAH